MSDRKTFVIFSLAIYNDIVNINKRFENGVQVGSIDSVLHSASYHSTVKSQIAAILQGMDHLFANGNKRTMVETVQMLLNRMNINQNIPEERIWEVVTRIATGDLRGVENIRIALFGYLIYILLIKREM